jgi:hypothetical protein
MAKSAFRFFCLGTNCDRHFLVRLIYLAELHLGQGL